MILGLKKQNLPISFVMFQVANQIIAMRFIHVIVTLFFTCLILLSIIRLMYMIRQLNKLELKLSGSSSSYLSMINLINNIKSESTRSNYVKLLIRMRIIFHVYILLRENLHILQVHKLNGEEVKFLYVVLYSYTYDFKYRL